MLVMSTWSSYFIELSLYVCADIGIQNVANFMEQSSWWEADSFSAVKFLAYSPFSEAQDSSQHTPIYFFKICFNIILPSKLTSSNLLFPSWFLHTNHIVVF
jgi:hypothetical protein